MFPLIFLHNDIALLFFGNNKKKVTGSNAATKEKKLPEKEAAEKDKEISISLLNIQVGLLSPFLFRLWGSLCIPPVCLVACFPHFALLLLYEFLLLIYQKIN